MSTPPTTLLERLARNGFPTGLLYSGRGLGPLLNLILSSHSILERAQKDWEYKSLADFAAEDFILNCPGWVEHHGWEGRAIDDFSNRFCCLPLYEENEGLTFHVRDGERFRPAKAGDEAYDFVCRLREEVSITNLSFNSAPSWAHELHLFYPNYFAYKTLWSEVPSLSDPSWGVVKKMRADAVTRETEKLAIALRSVERADASAGTSSDDEHDDDAWDGGFDPKHPKYPEELDIALQAWRAVYNVESSIKPLKLLENWLSDAYPLLSNEAISRISKVCNWDRTGGRPRNN